MKIITIDGKSYQHIRMVDCGCRGCVFEDKKPKFRNSFCDFLPKCNYKENGFWVDGIFKEKEEAM